MAITIKNLLVEQFYRTTLNATVTADATEIFVADASGFPDITTPDVQYFYLTLVEGDRAEVVKIGTIDKGNNKLTTFTGTFVQGGYSSESARAEHWFTAQAFRDIQFALDDIDGGAAFTPDDLTLFVEGSLAKVKPLGVDTTHLAADAVNADKLADNAVGTEHYQNDSIENIHLQTGIDATKITLNKLLLAVIPQITFAQIDYDTTPGGPPAGGSDGDIYIEWEDFV